MHYVFSRTALIILMLNILLTTFGSDGKLYATNIEEP